MGIWYFTDRSVKYTLSSSRGNPGGALDRARTMNFKVRPLQWSKIFVKIHSLTAHFSKFSRPSGRNCFQFLEKLCNFSSKFSDLTRKFPNSTQKLAIFAGKIAKLT